MTPQIQGRDGAADATPLEVSADKASTKPGNNKTKFVWLILGLALAVALVVGAWPTSSSSNADRAAQLAREIRCPTCQGLSVGESDAPMARSSRAEITDQVSAGRSDQQIRDYFTARYGNTALVSADKSGLGLLPWLAVPLGVVLVAGFAVWTVRRWRRQSDAQTDTETDVPRVEPRKSVPVFKSTKTQQRVTWGVLGALIATLVVVGVVSSATQREGEGGDSRQARVGQLLAQAGEQTAAQRPADAVRTYDAALAIDPQNTTALAYKGWLIRLAGMPDEGQKWIDKAIAADPDYPDARFFKGFLLLRDKNDPAGAVNEFDAYLALNPADGMKQAVESARQEALSAISAANR